MGMERILSRRSFVMRPGPSCLPDGRRRQESRWANGLKCPPSICCPTRAPGANAPVAFGPLRLRGPGALPDAGSAPGQARLPRRRPAVLPMPERPMRTATFLPCLFMLPVAVLAQDGGRSPSVTATSADPGAFRSARHQPDWQPAAPTEPSAPLTSLRHIRPGDRPDGAASRGARARALRLLTPGEMSRCGWAHVCFREGPASIRRRPSDVRRAACTLAAAHRWRSRQYITPSCCPALMGARWCRQRAAFDERPFDLAAEETAVLADVERRADARPGVYTARHAAGRRQPRLLLLHIEVLPFQLQRPEDRAWLLYADAALAHDERFLAMAELRDFARHGITGLVAARSARRISGLKRPVVFDASSYKNSRPVP